MLLFHSEGLLFELSVYRVSDAHMHTCVCVSDCVSVVCACRLHMVTWNVATADPPDDVSSLLHLNSPKNPDLYVIG